MIRQRPAVVVLRNAVCDSRLVLAWRRMPTAIPARSWRRPGMRRGRVAAVRTQSPLQTLARRSQASCRFVPDVDLAGDPCGDEGGTEFDEVVDGLVDHESQSLDFFRLSIEESRNLHLF